MLQGLEVLLLFASSTLDEVHPVTIFGEHVCIARLADGTLE